MIASLIGRSPQAYDLWRLREDGGQQDGEFADQTFAVVDARRSNDGLAETLSSIRAAGLIPVFLGEPPADFQGEVIGRAGELGRLAPASGPMLLMALQPGDLVARHARQTYLEMLERDDRLLYGDDDLVDSAGRHREPHFKPDWNAELFRHHDYLSGASLVRVRGEELAHLPDDRWVEALIACLLSAGAKPKHVPAVLHHRRRRPDPQLPGSISPVPSSSCPSVSVIIPTRNKASLLRACLGGLRQTDYPEVEIIVVDNGSDEAEAVELLAQLQAREHGFCLCQERSISALSTMLRRSMPRAGCSAC
jgi:hypothetical protein